MKCTNHPEVDAQGMCVYCGKPFCNDCLVEVKGKMYCKNDLGNILDEAKQAANSQPIINISNNNTNTNTNNNSIGGVNSFSSKNKLVALILCIIGFFGFGGLHRFYTGKIGSGILYLFTCGFFYIGTVIDLICILAGGFRDKNGQFLK